MKMEKEDEDDAGIVPSGRRTKRKITAERLRRKRRGEERERQETRNGYRGGGYAMRDSPGWKSVRARAHVSLEGGSRGREGLPDRF